MSSDVSNVTNYIHKTAFHPHVWLWSAARIIKGELDLIKNSYFSVERFDVVSDHESHEPRFRVFSVPASVVYLAVDVVDINSPAFDVYQSWVLIGSVRYPESARDIHW